MAGDNDIHREVGLAFYMDDFLSMLRLFPAPWREILPVIVEGLYIKVFDGWSDVGKSPRDALVVPENYGWHARKRDPGDI